ncbi:hypothetical protein SCWH03_05380 [Streptomyces pacificus]|uniref:Uncharacterized protein n=1 Tax=Streptomyces pacificus TaxID=2705029 RepID=A0A6A0AR07_9ACTN|nr:hypothetical protein SCWH03_05380 [Streptomyces pacificus]
MVLTASIGYPVRCPHCPPDAGPVPPTHWAKHVQRHHPEAAPADVRVGSAEELRRLYVEAANHAMLPAVADPDRRQHLAEVTATALLDVRDRALARAQQRLQLADLAHQERTTPPPADVRDQITEAVGLHRNGPASDGRGWYRSDQDQAECRALADAVLRVPAIAEALAGIPLVCSDERHQAKVRALEEQLSETRNALAMQKGVSADLRVESKARGDKLERVRKYAAEIERSGWTGPALARKIRAALDPQEQPATRPPVHVGGRANAEYCPACIASALSPPWPFICPGEAAHEGPTEPAPHHPNGERP